MRNSMRPGVIVGLALALTACGASSGPAATTSPTRTPGPSGPPTATGTVQGDPSVAGPITFTSVLCSWPSATGEGIRIFGHPESQPSTGTALVILVDAPSVNVRVASGSGATYAQREFNGTGVSGFDASKGGTVTASLTEDKSSSVNPGTIGTVSSITFTVDCAGELPGTASITVTGSSPGGAVNGKVKSARVDCSSYPQGPTADVTGLITVGGKTVLIIVGVYWAGITVAMDAHFYTNSDPATGSATATSGHWSGTVTDATSHTTLEVSGSATCGSSTKTAAATT